MFYIIIFFVGFQFYLKFFFIPIFVWMRLSCSDSVLCQNLIFRGCRIASKNRIVVNFDLISSSFIQHRSCHDCQQQLSTGWCEWLLSELIPINRFLVLMVAGNETHHFGGWALTLPTSFNIDREHISYIGKSIESTLSKLVKARDKNVFDIYYFYFLTCLTHELCN